MKKIKNRAIVSIFLLGMLALGLGIFLTRYFTAGANWVSFPVNRHVFTQGELAVGAVLDRNGIILSDAVNGKRIFHESKTIRRSVVHIVGDAAGNIGTGTLSKYKSLLMGYNPITGVTLTGAAQPGANRTTSSAKQPSAYGEGNRLHLTIDAELNAVAYKALDGRNGTVLVSNYKTGEILCLVSSPGFDPASPPSVSADDKGYEGIYINKAFSSKFVPGSTFKVITTAAAIDQINDLFQQEFHCDGQTIVNGETITCEGIHGTIDIQDAFAVSCNAAYARLSQQLGGTVLKDYADKFGLTTGFAINDINVSSGFFEAAKDGSADLSWSGIGQSTDLVNPAGMLKLMGAIANDGKAVNLRVLQKATTSSGIPVRLWFQGSERLMSSKTADTLAKMMRYNASSVYGDKNFPGLDLCAKTGTAQVGGNEKPHAWFVGFLRNDEFPYAFVVLIENGGSGRTVAGSVANKVLQAAVKYGGKGKRRGTIRDTQIDRVQSNSDWSDRDRSYCERIKLSQLLYALAAS